MGVEIRNKPRRGQDQGGLMIPKVGDPQASVHSVAAMMERMGLRLKSPMANINHDKTEHPSATVHMHACPSTLLLEVSVR